MTPSDHPESPSANVEGSATTGIQAAADLPSTVEAPSIPLPPLPQPPTMDAAQFLRLRDGLDAALVVLVVLFAFLVASFPVVNPDFFQQLATGRLLVEGGYHFGVDPFVFSTGGEYWVNHSWLFALLLYGIYQIPAVGGAAVVVVKALLIAVLAAVLVRAGRRVGQSLWIPAVCAALAILALSPRLFLQPTCLSFLFLGLTFWLLTAFGPQRTPKDEKRLWLLPPLFALWVNCDQWFFLGPLTLALYLAGEGLQHWLPSDAGETDGMRQCRRLWMLAAVLGAGVAACLVNPHHVHAWQLPPELGFAPAGDLIESDPQFQSLFLSPLSPSYYEDSRRGLSVAGVAYWPLLVVGLTSFGFVFRRLDWRRLLVWLCFALLSLYNVRAIPFFAIVAGPITALNWLDFAARRLGAAPRLTRGWRNGSLGGRAATVLAALLLLLAALPGWLQAKPRDDRRVSWSVRVDPSLEAMARKIQEWRRGQQLPDEPHWFNAQSEIANYVAWFAPGERVFLDQAMPRSRQTAHDYLDIREGLKQSSSEANASGDADANEDRFTLKRDWRGLLRKHQVHFWIFDRSNLRTEDLIAQQQMLFSDPNEWLLCYLHGRIAIFAWRDPQEATSADFAKPLMLDLKRVAFGAEAEQAPPRGPEVAAAPREGWDTWWKPKPVPSAESETATLYEVRFSGLYTHYLHANSRAWQAAVETSAIGLALPCGPMPNNLLAIDWSVTYHALFPPGATRIARRPLERETMAMLARQKYLNGQDTDPTECLYLFVRAARRAVRANPEDARSYLLLGHAYLRLQEQTAERNFLEQAPRLAEIRRTQMVAAFQNCLRLKPEDSLALQAHQILYKVFLQLGYLDVAAYHLREFLAARKRLEERSAAKPAEPSKSDSELTGLEREVTRRQNEYEVSSAVKPVFQKIPIALEKGLAETALSAFQQATPADLSRQSVAVVEKMKELLLNLGRLNEARELLIPDPEMAAGQPVSPPDLALLLRLAAARGDYEEADRYLADTLRYAWKDANGVTSNTPNQARIARAIGRVLLAVAQQGGRIPRLPWAPNDPQKVFSSPLLGQPLELGQSPSEFWVRRWRFEVLMAGVELQEQRSGWHLLRGWLALEAGRCVEARKHFNSAGDEQVAPGTWSPEVNKLKNPFFEIKGQPAREQNYLQVLRNQQTFTHSMIRHYLRLMKSQG